MKNPAAVALGTLGGKVKSETKAKSSAANGAKGGRPRLEWLVVVQYDCQLGEKGTIVSKHKSYDLARAAAKKSIFDDHLAIRNITDIS